MAVTSNYARDVFKGLETGDGATFFEHVADGVDWTVMGTHPLAGHYLSKRAFQEATFGKLSKVLLKGTQLRVTNVIVAGSTAVVELVSDATARNGMRFDNHYCWVVRFDANRIVEVRAYLDSAMVAELFRQNPV
jgi:ketosteroid isomerase-like protein